MTQDADVTGDPHTLSSALEALAQVWGERATRHEMLARHTTVNIGGPADLYIEAVTWEELREFVLLARQHAVPYLILGSGSNVLIGDAGVRGVVIANRARRIEFRESEHAPREILAWAESGAVLPTLARECIERGYANLEWAIGIPGTVGGAVLGNAGAHGGEIAHTLVSATILDSAGTVREWSQQELAFGYRTSQLKMAHRRWPGDCGPVILAATFRLCPGHREELEARAAGFIERRKRVQPPGATMGSMFKNPPSDYAGRLIEAAGLKGARIGNAQISPLHANFFINLGGATAAEMQALIALAQERVREQAGVELELEIELIGA